MSAVWQQTYNPADNIWVSALVAFLPILLFFVTLTALRMRGWLAATLTVLVAIAVALFFYRMPFAQLAATTVYGFFYGLWPIGWIIVTVVFLYKISVRTGQFAVLRDSILSLTADQRLQILLVGFSFGAFLEGAAGFGTPVAVTAALLAGLGFKPMYAAGLCLIANTAPVAFGAVGIPIIVAGQVSGIPPLHVGAMVGRQLPFLTIIVVFVIMAIMDGWRGVRETWPAVLVAGGSFAICQYLSSNFLGPELPDIISALVSLVALAAFLKVWRPASIFRFSETGDGAVHLAPDSPEARPTGQHFSAGQVLWAWSPYVVLTLVIALWSIPPFKKAVAGWAFDVAVPHLDNLVQKMPPIVAQATAYAAHFKWDWFSATGTAILVAAVITIIATRTRISVALDVAGETFRELGVALYIIGAVLAFAFIANYSGLSVTIALALAQSGHAFTFISPFLGWLGVFLTGSDTSSNALFAALQAATAHQIGVSELLLVATNSSGGVVGKMISPQSIAIACAAVGLVGHESELVRFTLKYSLLFAAIIGVIATLQAYVVPWMIPNF